MADIKRATKNTFTRGVTMQERYKTQEQITGIPREGHWGDPVDPGQNATSGIPMPGTGTYKKPYVPKPVCAHSNWRGAPCGMAPIKGTEACVAHTPRG